MAFGVASTEVGAAGDPVPGDPCAILGLGGEII